MWLTERQAQDYLGVSRITLWRLRRRGVLQVYKVGGQRLNRYRKEDLDSLMQPSEEIAGTPTARVAASKRTGSPQRRSMRRGNASS